jgi:hypothetical protein
VIFLRLFSFPSYADSFFSLFLSFRIPPPPFCSLIIYQLYSVYPHSFNYSSQTSPPLLIDSTFGNPLTHRLLAAAAVAIMDQKPPAYAALQLLAKNLLTKRILVLTTFLIIIFYLLLTTPLPQHHFHSAGVSSLDSDSDTSTCNPYSGSIYLHLNNTKPLESTFASFSSCQPTQPPWLNQLILTKPIAPGSIGRGSPPIQELTNKTLLLIGDSVDRFLVTDLCSLIGGVLTIHPINSFSLPASDEEKDNKGLPRSCFLESHNLTLANYFFYGYDEWDIWRDKMGTWSAPGTFEKRWEELKKAYKTLPKEPEVVTVNFGLWELARFDKLKESAEDPQEVDQGFVEEYISSTEGLLRRVRELAGNKARVVWRQMHTPKIEDGSYWVDKKTGKGGNRKRFAARKVRVLNLAAGEVVARVNERERERKSKGNKIDWWQVGDLMAPYPHGWWLRDDIHPNPTMGAVVWGGGVLEFLARTPRRGN